MEDYNDSKENFLIKEKNIATKGNNVPCQEFNIFENLQNGEAKIAVVGLSNSGLKTAFEFASRWNVIGYDVNEEIVSQIDKELTFSSEKIDEINLKHNLQFSSNELDITNANFFIVNVPTPIEANKKSNLGQLKSASASIAKHLKKGDYVVFETTVYPGCTEEECIPILENISGLRLNKDFKVGYSPELKYTKDKEQTDVPDVKIVSGSDRESLGQLSKVYSSISKYEIYEASSIKVAEVSRIIQNSQRDINIAFMNELSQILGKMDIDMKDALRAAGTSADFLNFSPGLVGGDSLSLDPYLIIEKSKSLGHTPVLLSNARAINEAVPYKIGDQIAIALQKKGLAWCDAKVLMRGITFKEESSNISNSKAIILVNRLKHLGMKVDIVDPLADENEVLRKHDLVINQLKTNQYDVIIQAVSHDIFISSLTNVVDMLGKDNVLLYDVKGVASKELRKKVEYLSL